MAPGVVSAGADVMRDALRYGDLQAVVVRSLVRAEQVDVRVNRRSGGQSELRVQRTAVVHRAAGVGVAAGLGEVRAGRARGAGGGDIELRSVQVVIDRQSP